MDNASGQYGFGEAPAPPLILAGSAADVLPRIDRQTLCDVLRRLPEEDLDLALRLKLVALVNLPVLALYAACGPAALAEGERRGLKIVAYADAHDLLAAARGVHGTRLAADAAFGLARRMPQFSARQRLTAEQAAVLVAMVVLATAVAQTIPAGLLWPLASLVSAVFFLSVVALRLLCLLPPVGRTPTVVALEEEAELPSYSVLVPLFRETRVLLQIVGALKRLRYPEDKLDIKLILEEEDIGMQVAVAELALPPQFEVIVVPAGRPQTKPRALNYALPFCRGSLLTIYDAEDIPDPDQLEKAAARFAGAGPDLACLQAQLTFFNPNENWLARQFTAEYALLFGRLLPVLADHRLPMALGGTSNHFRIEALRAVGGWDPFNVTEDADLGLRLARCGYQTAMLDSLTYEEANTRFRNWMWQRARWLKGFLATWLVIMRDPAELMRELGPAGFWVSQVTTIGVFASALLHPICLVAVMVMAILYPVLPADVGFLAVAAAGFNLLVFVLSHVLAIMLTHDAMRRRGVLFWRGTLATMPLYWVLMSAAAWLALWQFITQPFHWNKTEHGLTRFQGVRRRRVSGLRRFRRAARRGGG